MMLLLNKWVNKSLGMVEVPNKTLFLEKSQVHRLWQRLKKQSKGHMVVRMFKTI
jgi:hypothetical protein